MTDFDFGDTFKDFLGRKKHDSATSFGDRIKRKADRRRSGVCQLGFHVLCSGRGQDGGPCRCVHHEVGDAA